MGKAEVIGPAKRFGARYGSKLRKGIASIELRMRGEHRCPRCCTYGKVRRISIGMWECRKCGLTFAGGAYVPKAAVGVHTRRRE